MSGAIGSLQFRSCETFSVNVLRLKAEIARERASSLKLAAHQLERACRELEALEGELAKAAPDDRPRIVRRHEELRQVAKEQLYKLVVQREAMGMHNHDVVYEVYNVPRSLAV